MPLENIVRTSLLSSVLFGGCSASHRFNSEEFAAHFDKKEFYVDNANSDGPYIFTFGGFGVNILRSIAKYVGNRCDIAGCTSIDFGEWPEAMPLIKNQIHNKRELVFVAHSLGCADALDVCRILNEKDVKVDLVLYDAVHFDCPLLAVGRPNKIPSNINIVINYYATKGMFSASPLREDILENPQTKIYNFPVDCEHGDFNTTNLYQYYAEHLNRFIGVKFKEDKDAPAGN